MRAGSAATHRLEANMDASEPLHKRLSHYFGRASAGPHNDCDATVTEASPSCNGRVTRGFGKTPKVCAHNEAPWDATTPRNFSRASGRSLPVALGLDGSWIGAPDGRGHVGTRITDASGATPQDGRYSVGVSTGMRLRRNAGENCTPGEHPFLASPGA